MTTTINLRAILVGLLLTGCVLMFFASTATKPQSYVKPMAKTETVKFIYRGIPLGHPGYENALSGIAAPCGGVSTPTMHREGFTDSPYTSWTTDIMIAYQFATTGFNNRVPGVILMKKVDLSGPRFVDAETLPGGNIYKEAEIMVKGLMNGAVPILVKPGMDKNAILTLVRTL
jgi:hypothetical protein